MRLLLGAMLLLCSVPATGFAAPDRGKIQYVSSNAYVYECLYDEFDTCRYAELWINGQSDSVQVCITLETFSLVTAIYESGCGEFPASVLTFDTQRLDGAVLAPVTIQLYDYVGGLSREISLSATMTGINELQEFKNRWTTSDGTCTYTEAGRGKSRSMLAVINVDEESIELSDGYLLTSSSRFKRICK